MKAESPLRIELPLDAASPGGTTTVTLTFAGFEAPGNTLDIGLDLVGIVTKDGVPLHSVPIHLSSLGASDSPDGLSTATLVLSGMDLPPEAPVATVDLAGLNHHAGYGHALMVA